MHSPYAQVALYRGSIAQYTRLPCETKWFFRPVKPTWAGRTSLHADCICNERDSLVRRVMIKTPPITLLGKVHLRRAVTILCKMMCANRCVPWTREDYVKQVRPRKRKLYQSALDTLYTHPITKRDATVQMFVKADKFDKMKLGKAPRAIQSRSPRFNIELGRFLKPFESSIYSLKSICRKIRNRTRVCTKGLSSTQIGRLLLRKLNNFQQPMIFSLDATKFDASIRVEHLRANDRIYLTAYAGNRELQRLLSWRHYDKGRTKHGIKYETEGRRKSGDVDTSLGNLLNNLQVTIAAMKIMDVRKWDIMADGDDAILIVDRVNDPVAFAGRIRSTLCELGIKSTCFYCGGKLDLEKVEFCRSRFVWINGVLRLVRNASRHMANLFVTHKHYNDGVPYRWVRAMALCDLHVNLGVPIFQAYLHKICTLLSSYKLPKKMCGEDFAYRVKLLNRNISVLPKPLTISPRTRVSFERAFGVSPHHQVRLEHSYHDLDESWFSFTGKTADFKSDHMTTVNCHG